MSKNHPIEAQACTEKSCATGSCGGPGLCPGIALFIALIVGSGISMITGAWRWLPTKSADNAS